jgi:hypothetical protein
MKITTLLLLATALGAYSTSCSPGDQERARRESHEVEQQVKADAKKAGNEVEADAKKAGEVIDKDLKKTRDKVNEKLDEHHQD